MSATSSPRPLTQTRAYTFVWVCLAGIAGLSIAFLPFEITAGVIASFVFLLTVAITPLATITFLLTLAPLRTLIATESAINLPLDVGQLLFFVTLFAWLAHRIVQTKSLKLELSPILIPIIGFIIASGLSAFQAYSLGFWLNEWLKWVEIAILITLCADIGREGNWKWLVFALITAGLGNAFIGIYEFFGGSGADHLIVNERFFRAFGTFGQPNPFGGFMGLLAPLAGGVALGYLVRLLNELRHQKRFSIHSFIGLLYFGGATGILSIGVILSWSRGAWLGLAVAMAALVFALPRRFYQSVLLVGLLVALTFGLWSAGLLPQSIVSRIESATQETFSTSDVRGVDITPDNYALIERLAHWDAAISMAEAHPLFGVGFGNYEVAYPEFRLLNWNFPLGHAHNYYLNVLGETGMIGAFVYLTLWIIILIFTYQARNHPDWVARCTAAGLFGMWTYLLIHSLTDNLYVNNLFIHLGVALGILAVLHRDRHGVLHWVVNHDTSKAHEN